jgi:hypothetical protein
MTEFQQMTPNQGSTRQPVTEPPLFLMVLHLANSTRFLSVPIFEIETSIFVPGVRYCGGFMPAPTPIKQACQFVTLHLRVVEYTGMGLIEVKEELGVPSTHRTHLLAYPS